MCNMLWSNLVVSGAVLLIKDRLTELGFSPRIDIKCSMATNKKQLR